MTPLIDAVFLLLTFFIFSLVLMVPTDIHDITVPEFAAGDTARPADLITVKINGQGEYFVNDEQTDIESIAQKVSEIKQEQPDAVIFLAADVDATIGMVGPVIDTLKGAGLNEFSFVGRPSEDLARPNSRAPGTPAPE